MLLRIVSRDAYKLAFNSTPTNITNEKSTLVEVKAWCHQRKAIALVSVDSFDVAIWRHYATIYQVGITIWYFDILKR